MLTEYVAANAVVLFLTASFIGGVAVFYVVLQRTLRKRMSERAAH